MIFGTSASTLFSSSACRFARRYFETWSPPCLQQSDQLRLPTHVRFSTDVRVNSPIKHSKERDLALPGLCRVLAGVALEHVGRPPGGVLDVEEVALECSIGSEDRVHAKRVFLVTVSSRAGKRRGPGVRGVAAGGLTDARRGIERRRRCAWPSGSESGQCAQQRRRGADGRGLA